jgi:hypothetical protein
MGVDNKGIYVARERGRIAFETTGY